MAEPTQNKTSVNTSAIPFNSFLVDAIRNNYTVIGDSTGIKPAPAAKIPDALDQDYLKGAKDLITYQLPIKIDEVQGKLPGDIKLVETITPEGNPSVQFEAPRALLPIAAALSTDTKIVDPQLVKETKAIDILTQSKESLQNNDPNFNNSFWGKYLQETNDKPNYLVYSEGSNKGEPIPGGTLPISTNKIGNSQQISSYIDSITDAVSKNLASTSLGDLYAIPNIDDNNFDTFSKQSIQQQKLSGIGYGAIAPSNGLTPFDFARKSSEDYIVNLGKEAARTDISPEQKKSYLDMINSMRGDTSIVEGQGIKVNSPELASKVKEIIEDKTDMQASTSKVVNNADYFWNKDSDGLFKMLSNKAESLQTDVFNFADTQPVIGVPIRGGKNALTYTSNQLTALPVKLIQSPEVLGNNLADVLSKGQKGDTWGAVLAANQLLNTAQQVTQPLAPISPGSKNYFVTPVPISKDSNKTVTQQQEDFNTDFAKTTQKQYIQGFKAVLGKDKDGKDNSFDLLGQKIDAEYLGGIAYGTAKMIADIGISSVLGGGAGKLVGGGVTIGSNTNKVTKALTFGANIPGNTLKFATSFPVVSTLTTDYSGMSESQKRDASSKNLVLNMAMLSGANLTERLVQENFPKLLGLLPAYKTSAKDVEFAGKLKTATSLLKDGELTSSIRSAMKNEMIYTKFINNVKQDGNIVKNISKRRGYYNRLNGAASAGADMLSGTLGAWAAGSLIDSVRAGEFKEDKTQYTLDALASQAVFSLMFNFVPQAFQKPAPREYLFTTLNDLVTKQVTKPGTLKDVINDINNDAINKGWVKPEETTVKDKISEVLGVAKNPEMSNGLADVTLTKINSQEVLLSDKNSPEGKTAISDFDLKTSDANKDSDTYIVEATYNTSEGPKKVNTLVTMGSKDGKVVVNSESDLLSVSRAKMNRDRDLIFNRFQDLMNEPSFEDFINAKELYKGQFKNQVTYAYKKNDEFYSMDTGEQLNGFKPTKSAPAKEIISEMFSPLLKEYRNANAVDSKTFDLITQANESDPIGQIKFLKKLLLEDERVQVLVNKMLDTPIKVSDKSYKSLVKNLGNETLADSYLRGKIINDISNGKYNASSLGSILSGGQFDGLAADLSYYKKNKNRVEKATTSVKKTEISKPEVKKTQTVKQETTKPTTKEVKTETVKQEVVKPKKVTNKVDATIRDKKVSDSRQNATNTPKTVKSKATVDNTKFRTPSEAVKGAISTVNGKKAIAVAFNVLSKNLGDITDATITLGHEGAHAYADTLSRPDKLIFLSSHKVFADKLASYEKGGEPLTVKDFKDAEEVAVEHLAMLYTIQEKISKEQAALKARTSWDKFKDFLSNMILGVKNLFSKTKTEKVPSSQELQKIADDFVAKNKVDVENSNAQLKPFTDWLKAKSDNNAKASSTKFRDGETFKLSELGSRLTKGYEKGLDLMMKRFDIKLARRFSLERGNISDLNGIEVNNLYDKFKEGERNINKSGYLLPGIFSLPEIVKTNEALIEAGVLVPRAFTRPQNIVSVPNNKDLVAIDAGKAHHVVVNRQFAFDRGLIPDNYKPWDMWRYLGFKNKQNYDAALASPRLKAQIDRANQDLIKRNEALRENKQEVKLREEDSTQSPYSFENSKDSEQMQSVYNELKSKLENNKGISVTESSTLTKEAIKSGEAFNNKSINTNVKYRGDDLISKGKIKIDNKTKIEPVKDSQGNLNLKVNGENISPALAENLYNEGKIKNVPDLVKVNFPSTGEKLQQVTNLAMPALMNNFIGSALTQGVGAEIVTTLIAKTLRPITKSQYDFQREAITANDKPLSAIDSSSVQTAFLRLNWAEQATKEVLKKYSKKDYKDALRVVRLITADGEIGYRTVIEKQKVTDPETGATKTVEVPIRRRIQDFVRLNAKQAPDKLEIIRRLKEDNADIQKLDTYYYQDKNIQLGTKYSLENGVLKEETFIPENLSSEMNKKAKKLKDEVDNGKIQPIKDLEKWQLKQDKTPEEADRLIDLVNKGVISKESVELAKELRTIIDGVGVNLKDEGILIGTAEAFFPTEYKKIPSFSESQRLNINTEKGFAASTEKEKLAKGELSQDLKAIMENYLNSARRDIREKATFNELILNGDLITVDTYNKMRNQVYDLRQELTKPEITKEVKQNIQKQIDELVKQVGDGTKLDPNSRYNSEIRIDSGDFVLNDKMQAHLYYGGLIDVDPTRLDTILKGYDTNVAKFTRAISGFNKESNKNALVVVGDNFTRGFMANNLGTIKNSLENMGNSLSQAIDIAKIIASEAVTGEFSTLGATTKFLSKMGNDSSLLGQLIVHSNLGRTNLMDIYETKVKALPEGVSNKVEMFDNIINNSSLVLNAPARLLLKTTIHVSEKVNDSIIAIAVAGEINKIRQSGEFSDIDFDLPFEKRDTLSPEQTKRYTELVAKAIDNVESKWQIGETDKNRSQLKTAIQNVPIVGPLLAPFTGYVFGMLNKQYKRYSALTDALKRKDVKAATQQAIYIILGAVIYAFLIAQARDAMERNGLGNKSNTNIRGEQLPASATAYPIPVPGQPDLVVPYDLSRIITADPRSIGYGVSAYTQEMLGVDNPLGASAIDAGRDQLLGALGVDTQTFSTSLESQAGRIIGARFGTGPINEISRVINTTQKDTNGQDNMQKKADQKSVVQNALGPDTTALLSKLFDPQTRNLLGLNVPNRTVQVYNNETRKNEDVSKPETMASSLMRLIPGAMQPVLVSALQAGQQQSELNLGRKLDNLLKDFNSGKIDQQTYDNEVKALQSSSSYNNLSPAQGVSSSSGGRNSGGLKFSGRSTTSSSKPKKTKQTKIKVSKAKKVALPKLTKISLNAKLPKVKIPKTRSVKTSKASLVKAPRVSTGRVSIKKVSSSKLSTPKQKRIKVSKPNSVSLRPTKKSPTIRNNQTNPTITPVSSRA